MADMVLWKNGRIDSLRFVDLVDWNEVAEVSGITGGTITENYLSDLKYSASFDYAGEVSDGWLDRQIRVYLDTVSKVDSSLRATVPLGTFMTTTPSRTVGRGTSEFTITAYSPLILLQNKRCVNTYSLLAGSNVIAAVRALCSEVGLPIRYVDSPYVLQSDYVSEKNDTYLTVVNALLSRAGYNSIYVDPYGNGVLSKYVAPDKQAVVWTFADGEECEYLPEIDVEWDAFDTPNEYIIVASDSERSNFTVVRNEDESDPLSISRRGMVISEVVELDYYDTEDNLKALGSRRISESRMSIENYTFTHWYVPVHSGDSVIFKNKNVEDGSDVLTTIHTMDITLSPGLSTKTKVRHYRSAQ